MVTKPAGFRANVKQLTEPEAEALTAEIVAELDKAATKTIIRYRDIVPLILRAFRGRAWNAVGYTSWEDYCRANFHGPRMIRFTDSQLTELCVEFAGEGMSVRAIGSALGIGHATAARKIRRAEEDQVDDDGQEAEEAEVFRLSDGARIKRNRSLEAAKAAHPAGKARPVVPADMRPAEVVFLHISFSGGEGLTWDELCGITDWRESIITGALGSLYRSDRIRKSGTARGGFVAWVEVKGK